MADIRAFIAVKLDDRMHRKLEQVMDELRPAMPRRGIRWVAAEDIHLTLKFLGDVPPAPIAPITEALSRAAAGSAPFSFEVGGLGCFPNTRRPAVLWVGIQEPGGSLSALQNAVETELEKLGFAREARRFSPHLTLGRVRREISPADARAIGQVVENVKPKSLGRQDVAALYLLQSDLRPDGPIYTVLAEWPLGRH